jgi:hypothetical protein
MPYEVVYGYTKVEGIKSLHLHFETLWEKKNKIATKTTNIVTDVDFLMHCSFHKDSEEYIHCFLERNDAGEPKHYPVYFKRDRKSGKPKLVKDYPDVYLYNTLIKELLGAGPDGSTTMAHWVTFMLYYYRFFRSESKEEMYNAVLSDIADIISIIIQREFTTYHDFNTGAAIESLRWKHRSERVQQLGKAPRNLNLRRRY